MDVTSAVNDSFWRFSSCLCLSYLFRKSSLSLLFPTVFLLLLLFPFAPSLCHSRHRRRSSFQVLFSFRKEQTKQNKKMHSGMMIFRVESITPGWFTFPPFRFHCPLLRWKKKTTTIVLLVSCCVFVCVTLEQRDLNARLGVTFVFVNLVIFF